MYDRLNPKKYEHDELRNDHDSWHSLQICSWCSSEKGGSSSFFSFARSFFPCEATALITRYMDEWALIVFIRDLIFNIPSRKVHPGVWTLIGWFYPFYVCLTMEVSRVLWINQARVCLHLGCDCHKMLHFGSIPWPQWHFEMTKKMKALWIPANWRSATATIFCSHSQVTTPDIYAHNSKVQWGALPVYLKACVLWPWESDQAIHCQNKYTF